MWIFIIIVFVIIVIITWLVDTAHIPDCPATVHLPNFLTLAVELAHGLVTVIILLLLLLL